MNHYRLVDSELGLWTVGFRIPYTERWESDSDHNSKQEAQDRVNWLNGLGRGFVYRRTEPNLWTIGTFGRYGVWQPVFDTVDQDEAAREVACRNGSHVEWPVKIIEEG